MMRFVCQLSGGLALVGLSLLWPWSLGAQPGQPPPVPPGLQVAGSPAPASSPVELFRKLLAISAAERRQELAERSPEERKLILAKVREYEALKAEQRELRLQATELHWYLWPLMNSPATNRVAQLERIPPASRRLVSERLREWDKLPRGLQGVLLTNEATLRFFTELSASSEQQRSNLLSSLSPARRLKLEQGIENWQGLAPEQQQKMMERFRQFFELTAQEKQKALATVSESEQRQMERTRRKFEQLPAQQRAACIRSFGKFAGMSLAERQQFLKNAERWKLMTPTERAGWKELVDRLSVLPPMPPGLGLPPLPPMPSRPPGLKQVSRQPPPLPPTPGAGGN